MCGIYGTTINFKKEQVVTKLERIHFRGPDYMGIESYSSDNRKVTFGHNVLTILTVCSLLLFTMKGSNYFMALGIA